MSIDRMRILAVRVIQQRFADPRSLVLLIVVPIILLSVAGILIKQGGGDITLALVNQDAGQLGEQLAAVLEDNENFKTVRLDAAAAESQIKAGDLDAIITLPSDFSQTALTQRTIMMDVQYEGSNPTVSKRLEGMFDQISAQALNRINQQANDAPDIQVQINNSYLNGGSNFDTLDFMAPALIATFVFLFVFILTSISFLRERVAGTLERLQATPINSMEIVIGYMLGFLLFGLLQGVVTLLFTVFVLDINYLGNLFTVFLVESLLVITSVNLGIFMSTFAHNEFQVLQFIPLVVVTQVFLGGVLWDIQDMPDWLQVVAQFMPLTHANNALRDIMIKGVSLGDTATSLLALSTIAILAVILSARTAGRVRI